MRVGKFVQPVGGLPGQQLLLLTRGEHHSVLFALELRTRKGACQTDLHVAVHIPIRLQGELSDNGHIADLEGHVMQFRTREAVLHGIQLFGSDDDAHLFQLLQLQIRSVEFDFFELVGGNTMIVEGFKALGVFGIVGKAQQRLCNFAGLVGGDFQKMKRLGVFLRHETLDEGRDCGAVAKFVERRLVGRKRLCRRNLVLVAALLEVGNGLYGAVLLVVEQERFLVLRIGLLGSLVRVLILIFFGHKANVLSETKGSCREYRSMFSETMPMSAPVRSSPHRSKNYGLSCPEKSLQKRVNLMQKNQGRILYIGILYNNVGAKL